MGEGLRTSLLARPRDLTYSTLEFMRSTCSKSTRGHKVHKLWRGTRSKKNQPKQSLSCEGGGVYGNMMNLGAAKKIK